MIEGLRILPWLQSATRKTPTAVQLLNNCKACMQRTTTKERQRMGCGYEKPPRGKAAPWTPLGFKGAPIEHCPGYTTKLPEVVEASWARHWLEKGNIDQWSDMPITQQTRDAVQILEIAIADEQAHDLEQRQKAAKR